MHRKLALKIVKKTDTGHALQPSELHDYVGKPVFNQTRLYDVTPPGVVVGLAWTSMGMMLGLWIGRRWMFMVFYFLTETFLYELSRGYCHVARVLGCEVLLDFALLWLVLHV